MHTSELSIWNLERRGTFIRINLIYIPVQYFLRNCPTQPLKLQKLQTHIIKTDKMNPHINSSIYKAQILFCFHFFGGCFGQRVNILNSQIRGKGRSEGNNGRVASQTRFGGTYGTCSSSQIFCTIKHYESEVCSKLYFIQT